jgi:LL-H family phage holin
VDSTLVGNILVSPEFAVLIIAVLGSIVTGVIAWVGKRLSSLLDNRLSADQLRMLMEIAEKAVHAVEQTEAGALAQEKKAEAMRIAATYLQAYGIKVSGEQLSAAIEAAVYEGLSSWKPPVPIELTGIPGGPDGA